MNRAKNGHCRAKDIGSLRYRSSQGPSLRNSCEFPGLQLTLGVINQRGTAKAHKIVTAEFQKQLGCADHTRQGLVLAHAKMLS